MSVQGSRDRAAVLPMLSASKVGEFGGYCPEAWWLRRHGVMGAAVGAVRRQEGVVLHRALGRQTDRLREVEAGKRLTRAVAMALVLLAVALLLLRAAVRSPLAWAAGLEGGGLQQRVSTATGPVGAADLFAAAVVVGLLAASLCALALAARLGRRGRSLRGKLGLGGTLERAGVLAADDSRLGARTLRSERLGLVARPDHLIRLGNGAVIPVEQKPRARRLYPSHDLELGVQLILVEASVGRRPPYGLVVLAEGIQRRVAFGRSLEGAVVSTARQMRACLESDNAPGRRWLGARCRACEFYGTCWSDHP